VGDFEASPQFRCRPAALLANLSDIAIRNDRQKFNNTSIWGYPRYRPSPIARMQAGRQLRHQMNVLLGLLIDSVSLPDSACVIETSFEIIQRVLSEPGVTLSVGPKYTPLTPIEKWLNRAFY
jgi:hypothetical protein